MQGTTDAVFLILVLLSALFHCKARFSGLQHCVKACWLKPFLRKNKNLKHFYSSLHKTTHYRNRLFKTLKQKWEVIGLALKQQSEPQHCSTVTIRENCNQIFFPLFTCIRTMLKLSPKGHRGNHQKGHELDKIH